MEINKVKAEAKPRKSISPFKIKKEAVAALKNNQKTPEELCAEYGIARITLFRWTKQVEYGAAGHAIPAKIPEEVKRKAVREVVSGRLTIKDAVVKYGVRGQVTIKEWITRYSADLEIALVPKAMSPEEKEKVEALQQRCKELEKALEYAHLKVAGLETMIDIAEKELHIDIRKKPGSKQ